MKQLSDTKTVDFIGVPASPGRKRVYASTAERVAAWRARHAKKAFTVNLPIDLIDDLKKHLEFKDLTTDACIEKLIRTQLLRKR